MSMHYCQQGAVKPNVYVVTCKKCTRSIPAGAQEFPRGNLVVQCALCGELRRYRPSEVYLGFPDSHLVQQQVSAYAEMRQDRDAARARITQLENAIRPH